MDGCARSLGLTGGRHHCGAQEAAEYTHDTDARESDFPTIEDEGT